jgi:DNA-binding response OmpR family regulator
MAEKKIMLAEDEAHIARLIIFKLEREGFKVEWAQDGGEAIDKIKKTMPDLILLDVMMPVMDGFDVLKQIRADASLSAIPVFMLTAKGQTEDVEKGFGLGVDDYIIKPFRPAELVARIKGKLRM